MGDALVINDYFTNYPFNINLSHILLIRRTAASVRRSPVIAPPNALHRFGCMAAGLYTGHSQRPQRLVINLSRVRGSALFATFAPLR